jgi:hypothetical protein
VRYWLGRIGCVCGSIGMCLVGAFIWIVLGIGWCGVALWKTRGQVGSTALGLVCGLALTLIVVVLVAGGAELFCSASPGCSAAAGALFR